MEAVTDPPKSASYLYASELACREEVDHQLQLHKVFEETPWLLPKHKIFISHSGAQKDFAEQLCVDLERDGYYPFLDKREDSLPKGERFPDLIFKAARECLLAIVLLSYEFFTRSRWPMLELAAFVQAQKSRKDLRILPVLLGLTIQDLNSTAKWSELWTEWGKQHHRLNGDVITEWEAAVKALRPVNMILQSSYNGEVALRKGIVCSIIQAMPPDVRSDVVHVQGRERLCKELRSKFETAATSRVFENAKVLGIFGIGGAGKSTICMTMTEFVRSEFSGRVCHVELGTETSTLDLQRKVLRQLFRDNEDYLNRHVVNKDQGFTRLEEHMPRERVFLALDNVSDNPASIETATRFLKLKFHSNSMVLLTSRSAQVLCKSLGIPESNCVRCPSITLEEALHMLLEQVNYTIELLNTEQRRVLHQTVERSKFFHGYHPLALKVFAAQLGLNPATWRESDIDLQETSDVEHSLFTVIETSYERLPNQRTKDMFLDIALFTPEDLCTIQEISTWLHDTISFEDSMDQIKKKLSILRAKSLLEVWKMDDESVRIHDLYRMLAERKAGVDDGGSRFIYQRGGVAPPKALRQNDRATIIERAAFVEANFEMLGLKDCMNLEVLSIKRCEKLMTVCIQRLRCLVSLELAACPLENLDLSGLSNLRWLHVSACKNLMQVDATEVDQLGYVNVSKCRILEELNLGNCVMLRSVSILYNDNLQHVNVGRGEKLECLTLWFCESLQVLEISGVAHVTTLKKRGCRRLLSMQGGEVMCKDVEYMCLQSWGKLSQPFMTALERSTSLQVLDLWDTPISRLPDLKTCLYLRELRLSEVDVLLDSNKEELLHEYHCIMRISADHDLKLPISLEDIRIESCRNVTVKEVFSKLQGLTNLRLLSLQEVRVGWDWELYRSRNDKHDTADFVSGKSSNLFFKENEDVIERLIREEEVRRIREEEVRRIREEEVRRIREEVSSITSCLNEIMHWVKAFLNGGKKNSSQLEQSMKIALQPHWKTSAEPTILQLGELEELFWSNMIKTVDIGGSPCWVVEQIIQKSCSNCDPLCELLWQLLSIDWPEVRYLTELISCCQKAHVEEISWQLFILTAKHPADIVNQPEGYWDKWEGMIMREVVSRMKIPSCKTRYCEKGTQAVIARLEILAKRLVTLSVCREWKVDCRVESDKQELEQFAGDWLWACRVCLSIEQLKRYQDSRWKEATEVRCQLE